MKNLKLESYGTIELSVPLATTTNGGFLFLAAIPLAKAFAWGVATGVVVGGIVLDKILSEK